MHTHLATDQGVHSEACEAVFDHNGKLSCSLPTLKEVFLLTMVTHPNVHFVQDAARAVTYDIDHVFPGAHTEATPEVTTATQTT